MTKRQKATRKWPMDSSNLNVSFEFTKITLRLQTFRLVLGSRLGITRYNVEDTLNINVTVRRMASTQLRVVDKPPGGYSPI